MNDELYKGGRNHKAPYSTTHLRVPLELTNSLQGIIDLYKRAYKLDAENLRANLVLSLKQFANTFLQSHGVLVDSTNHVTLEKHTDVLKELEEANRELAFLTALTDELKQSNDEAQAILEKACELKSNAGGAIKKEIRRAILILD
jgi:hypothetical protein